jgi:hypothetical protein
MFIGILVGIIALAVMVGLASGWLTALVVAAPFLLIALVVGAVTA